MARMIRTLIVDHEPATGRHIRSLASTTPDLDVIGEARDGHEAVRAILAHAPDLVFLDVQIPALNAFDVVTTVGPHRMPTVVCVSSCGRHALRAFEIPALDYLVKPLDPSRVEDALSRVRRHRANQERGALGRMVRALVNDMQGGGTAAPLRAVPCDKTGDRIIVESHDRLLFVRVDDIDAIEAAGNHVRLHAHGEAYLRRDTLNAFEATLPPDRFIRIHRSHVVNLERIKELRPSLHGEYVVVLSNGTSLPLSRRHREALKQRFGRPL